MIEIAPSVLGADLMRLGEEIELVEKLGITWLHLDHMDVILFRISALVRTSFPRCARRRGCSSMCI